MNNIDAIAFTYGELDQKTPDKLGSFLSQFSVQDQGLVTTLVDKVGVKLGLKKEDHILVIPESRLRFLLTEQELKFWKLCTNVMDLIGVLQPAEARDRANRASIIRVAANVKEYEEQKAVEVRSMNGANPYKRQMVRPSEYLSLVLNILGRSFKRRRNRSWQNDCGTWMLQHGHWMLQHWPHQPDRWFLPPLLGLHFVTYIRRKKCKCQVPTNGGYCCSSEDCGCKKAGQKCNKKCHIGEVTCKNK